MEDGLSGADVDFQLTAAYAGVNAYLSYRAEIYRAISYKRMINLHVPCFLLVAFFLFMSQAISSRLEI
jgi:hypothetical protein